MSIIGWFKKKKKEKEDLESIKTALSEIQKAIEESPLTKIPETPTKFDIFLQTIEKITVKNKV